MDNWIQITLAGCGILLSVGMLTCMLLAISVLLKVNKISKLFVRVMGIINFEAKILAPLLMGKRIFDSFFKKTTKEPKNNCLTTAPEEKRRLSPSLPCLVKWAILGLAIWKVVRKRKNRR
ncbi:hypothetical protein [Chlamydiifrater phoenicopteri]|uniref:hypothetical protein n=1 Tax=Chlamydiifrater phoenicopteri TaxID=2681469 RepID=UPI001BD125AE|nr:hypothetical protein [Chlamydiifrater phoenicopteri]